MGTHVHQQTSGLYADKGYSDCSFIYFLTTLHG